MAGQNSEYRTQFNSVNFINGSFQNKTKTETITSKNNHLKVMKEFFFNKNKRIKPEKELPSVKFDLKNLGPDRDFFVWFGHSSYFLRLDGRNFLVDPVFNSYASPVPFTNRRYPVTQDYTPEDMPEIDFLLITHDHWDHLDEKSVKKLKSKIKQIIVPLGVGRYFQDWGFDKQIIIERDWFQTAVEADSLKIDVTPARHFSGRYFTRNQTLWGSFLIRSGQKLVYFGGDSGYDTHFKEIQTRYGSVDLAFLECGQYNENWRNIHMFPEETIQAGIDLGAKRVFAGHWSAFTLSLHAWDEPIIRAVKEAEIKSVGLVYPMIGEICEMDREISKQKKWWGF